MNLMLELAEKARRGQKRVVLPESQDTRIVQAAAKLASERICQPILVETPGLGSVPSGVELVRPRNDARTERFADELFELRKHKGMTREEAGERGEGGRQVLLDVLEAGNNQIHGFWRGRP